MSEGEPEAPRLVLGPLLRYVSETAATIWVETDRACQVEILGGQARTFEVAGHHYALVVLDGLRPGTQRPYEVALDGVVRWPEPESPFPPSVLRTLQPGRPVRLVFGSCRLSGPPPGQPDHGPDALAACAAGLRAESRERWPDALFLIGDQVYADETGPATRQFIERRRDPAVPPGYEIADFAEYCALYREAWSEPAVRWLLSVIPTAMIFDDHDVHDDWNTSAAWRREYRARPWWPARITGAYLSYWIYQHLGNMSPEDLAKDELWRQVRQRPDEAEAVLREMAVRADETVEGIQWSFRRSLGGVQVVVIDSRGGRVLADGGRLMVDAAEWEWITGAASGDWEHVVLATSLPLLLPRGIHAIEAWNEAVCDGAWGKRLARVGERVRRAADLEHWAAFGASFRAFEQLLIDLAAGARGRPPASVTVISGDIHHSYLAPVDLPRGRPARSSVYQAVCSPLRNTLPRSFQRGQRLATSRPATLVTTAAARLAGVRKPRIGWRITQGPWFDNMLGSLEFDGPAARLRLARAVTDAAGAPCLQPVSEARLS
jgi:hypothetical protein